MADFKCKYCGNSLHPEEGQTFIICPRCDETTRFIWQDDSKKTRLLEEANDLRFRCLFDRAQHLYDVIIQEFPNEADAYWGYILCEYGVEFQEEARTGKRVPTLHRISQKSMLLDPYYQKVLEYASPAEKKDYQRIAGELERIRMRFIELSQNEENQYEIFISFKQTDDRTGRETIDCSRAENLYYKLKDLGYRVFFSKVTLAGRGGDDYEPIIYTALINSKIMLVVGSSGENLEAPWVRNEWSRFLDLMEEDSRKKLLPVLIEGVQPRDLPDALQGIQGYNIDTSLGMDRLISRIIQLLPKQKPEGEKIAPAPKTFGVSEGSLLKRAGLEAKAGNWDDALTYYDKILEANPESAPAWMGRLLCSEDFRCVDLEEFGRFLVREGTVASSRTVSVTIGTPGTKEEDYVVPGYLTEEEITGMSPKQLSYETNVEALQQKLEEQEDWFRTNKYFSYAESYADGAYAQQLASLKKNVLNDMRTNLEQVRQQEEDTRNLLRSEYARELEEAQEKLKERYQQALSEREKDYKTGTEVKSSKDIPAAIRCLKKVEGYKDSTAKLKQLSEVQEKLNEIGEGINYLSRQVSNAHTNEMREYEQAVDMMKNNKGGLFFWIRLLVYGILVAAYVFVAVRTGLSGGFYIKSGSRMVLYNCAWTLIFMAGGILAALLFRGVPNFGFILYAVLYTLAFRTQYMPAVLSYVIYYFRLPVPDTFIHSMYRNITLEKQTVIIAVLFFLSWVFKWGVAHHFIAKAASKKAVRNTRKVIAAAEAQEREKLNTLWQNALGRSYDGPALETVLKM